MGADQALCGAGEAVDELLGPKHRTGTRGPRRRPGGRWGDVGGEEHVREGHEAPEAEAVDHKAPCPKVYSAHDQT